MAITADQINAAFEISARIYAGDLGRSEGQRRLVEDTGLNSASANHYIGAYLDMRTGKGFTRTINLEGLRIYLGRIRDENGPAALMTALASALAHADYRESLGRSKLPSFRRICAEFRSTSSLPVEDEADRQRALADGVAASARDRSEARLARLAEADRRPTATMTLRQEFVRNPDVIAEVQARAESNCEHCGAPAPFLRRDGRPYLEVHHRIPLAEGGEDTVENAVALCPNCHREAHHGEHWERFRP